VFAVLTVVDAVLLVRLPFQGDGADVVGALLFAGFLNLFVVAVLAPLAGVLVRRRRRDLPSLIARDYAGTGLLALITTGLLAGGLAHRSAVVSERADQRAMFTAVHDYVVHTEPEYIAGLSALDAVRLEPERYRACVYAPRERRPICLFVNTDQSPAGVRRDPSRDPNDGFRQ